MIQPSPDASGSIATLMSADGLDCAMNLSLARS